MGMTPGCGISNIFFTQIPSGRLPEAIQVIVAKTEERGLANDVIVAKSVEVPKEPDPDIEHAVVWPPGFPRKFDIFKWSGLDG